MVLVSYSSAFKWMLRQERGGGKEEGRGEQCHTGGSTSAFSHCTAMNEKTNYLIYEIWNFCSLWLWDKRTEYQVECSLGSIWNVKRSHLSHWNEQPSYWLTSFSSTTDREYCNMTIILVELYIIYPYVNNSMYACLVKNILLLSKLWRGRSIIKGFLPEYCDQVVRLV